MGREEAGAVREPAVAGTFYPASPGALEEAVRGFVDASQRGGSEEPPPKALIAPHAGYVYSGAVAGAAYARLLGLRGVSRVVLIGPAHRVPVRGFAVPAAGALATPLGEVPVDREGMERALEHPRVQVLDRAHAHEHSLEVQLPFLQVVLGRFRVVPIVAGDATAEECAELIESLWGGPETLVVVSSDLSHYLPYDAAARRDARTRRAIEELRPHDLDFDDACGRVPIQGLLLAARRRGLRVTTLDLRSSGDTAGPRDRVVGYGAWQVA